MERAIVEQLIWLLLTAFIVGLLVRRLLVPYTVALLVVGIGLSFTGLLSGLTLTSETILVIFLPTLLFQGAINLDLAELRQTVLSIALLAVAGVAISMAIIAGLFWLAIGVPLVVAIVLAATLSATDPVAVLAVFKRLGVPKRLEMVIEGESLFNDGTSLVAFQIAVGAVGSQGLGIGDAVAQFVLTVLGGLVLGALTGFLFSHLFRLASDHLIEMGLSTVLAYGTYLLGEQVHVSAVIAVVTAGIVLGNYGRRVGMSERARVVVVDVWEYLAFLTNSVLFLLLGQQIRLAHFPAHIWSAALAIGLVLLSRAAIIYGLAPIVSVLERHVPYSWRHVAFWGGLRGALAVAMVLSLPRSFPDYDLLLSATLAVVFFTIVVQGISIEHLVRRLKLREPRSEG